MDILACAIETWDLVIIECYNILKDFGFLLEGFFEAYIFAMVKNIWVSIILLLH
jgi:hypothetical protein